MKNIFGKFNIVDIIIVIGVILALLVGVFTTKHFRQTADKQIEATSEISFQVFLRGVTVTGTEFPIKAGKKTFITIRNVPYTELNVNGVIYSPRQTAIASNKSEQYILVNDPSQPAIFDAIISITDVAKITKDGAVVGGNKIKMGLPVTLEGENYKFNGTISDVHVTSDVKVEDSGEKADIS